MDVEAEEGLVERAEDMVIFVILLGTTIGGGLRHNCLMRGSSDCEGRNSNGWLSEIERCHCKYYTCRQVDTHCAAVLGK